MIVALASKNPAKVQAVERAMQQLFPDTALQYQTLTMASGVSEQPMSDEETRLGAENRLQSLMQETTANFYFSIEGGCENDERGRLATAWIFCSDGEKKYAAKSAGFYLSEELVQAMDEGLELGEACDKVYGLSESKKGQGAIGLLSFSLIDRIELYRPAVIFAAMHFKKNTNN